MSIEAKIASLETLLADQQDRLKRSIRNTFVIYGILVLFVLAYSSVVLMKIKQSTSPEAMAELATGYLNSELPKARESMVAMLEEHADEWAEGAAEYVTDSIPAMENQVQFLLDDLTDKLVEHLRAQLVPAFTEFIREDAAELRERFKDLNDDEVIKGITLTFLQVIDEELDSYLNERFVAQAEELQIALHKLADPNRRLTRKQLAQRQAIHAWAYLAEHAETGDTVVTELLAELKKNYLRYMKDEPEPDEEKLQFHPDE